MSYKRKGDSFYFTVDLGRDVKEEKFVNTSLGKLISVTPKNSLLLNLNNLNLNTKKSFERCRRI